MEVLVYKTNIHQRVDVDKVGNILNKHSEILKWNVDIEDEDCVLRVEAHLLIGSKIVELVKDAGYHCDELE